MEGVGDKIKQGFDYPELNVTVQNVLKDISREGLLTDFEGQQLFFLIKGSIESLESFIDPSIAAKARLITQSYQQQGYRVLGMAYRAIATDEMEHMMDYEEAEFLASGLNLLGLIILETKMANGVEEMVTDLRDCDIKMSIISGDSEIACAHCAFSSKIVEPSHSFMLINSKGTPESTTASLIYRIGEGNCQLQPLFIPFNELLTFLSEFLPLFADFDKKIVTINSHKLELFNLKLNERYRNLANVYSTFEAIKTLQSRSFSIILNQASFTFLQEYPQFLHSISPFISIFAQMTPVSKIKALQKLKQSALSFEKFAFVGDGANDVGAINCADVGISFLGCEGSVGAGFVLPANNIASIEKVISEGKACLAVCHQLFQYIVFYSVSQFLCLLYLYFLKTDFSNGQYYTMDLMIITPISLFMCFHGAKKMNSNYPPDSLFNKYTIISLFGNFLIFCFAMFKSCSKLPEDPVSDKVAANFYLLSSDLIAISLLFSRGHPFRVGWWNNKYLLSAVGISSLFLLFCFYGFGWDDGWFWVLDQLQMKPTKQDLTAVVQRGLLVVLTSQTLLEVLLSKLQLKK